MGLYARELNICSYKFKMKTHCKIHTFVLLDFGTNSNMCSPCKIVFRYGCMYACIYSMNVCYLKGHLSLDTVYTKHLFQYSDVKVIIGLGSIIYCNINVFF